MSCYLALDRPGTWYTPMWLAKSGVHLATIGAIADHVTDPALRAWLREYVEGPAHGALSLSRFTEEQQADVIRVILGPLRAELRYPADELIPMAEGWAAATDVFPVFVPGEFVRQPAERGTLRYRAGAVELTFTGVRGWLRPPKALASPTIELTGGGYSVSTPWGRRRVRAAGLDVTGDERRGPLHHTVTA